ncbi:TolB protein [Anaerosolibacter carboniphilus]|uniref:TolB protein n=1 Tax=Anaerosolibacter carboniphilus TaxID=1417629 RepID=A0A841KLJ1_9FIRM|nr:hypothetical protein [Anaerosolibacter carboniphilus]MBB6214273.1 TolB protein [Anaerosolibacter carboniphilus]
MNKLLKHIGCIALLLILIVSSGCSAKTAEREEINSDGKKITILNTKTPLQTENAALGNDFEVEKIDRYEGIRGEDWLTEDVILITKENTELDPIFVSDQMSNIRNLYSYNLKSKEEKNILKETEFLWRPIVSPDRKHIFSEKFEPDKYTGLILDIEGNVKTAIESDAATGLGFSLNSGRWVDNEEVIIPSSNEGVYLIDVDSNISKIEGIGRMQTDDAVKVGDKIYYVSVEKELVAYDTNTKQREVIKDNVLNFELSPHKDTFAIEKKVSANRTELVLIDLDGNEKATLLEAKLIFGLSWSPDQSKLAYLITSEDESKSGLYVMDLASERSLYVSRDFINIDGGLKWSPSSKKILASIGEVKDMKVIDNTYVISLK